MALKNQVANVYGVGLRNVGSYQVSGHPYATGSTWNGSTEQTVSFPYVTKNFTIRNSSPSGWKKLYIRFDAVANMTSDTHRISLQQGESIKFDVKCTKVYIQGYSGAINNYEFELYASLTNIPTERMYTLSDSGIRE